MLIRQLWRRSRRLVAFVLLPLFLSVPATRAQDLARREALEQSRSVALNVTQTYRTQLIRELRLSGPARALLVCRYGCPEIVSAEARKTGWGVSLVSLKPRNAAIAMPDVWDQRILLDFERRIAEGERAEGLEFAEVVTEPQGRFFRYARAIVMDSVCLTCHGPVETLDASVKALLAIHYPFDKATGYREGDLYGAVTVKRPY